ncbi:MAG: VWA domain-containing protein [Chloroflexota bacterium]
MSITFIYPQYLWLLLLVPLTVGLGLAARRTSSRARLSGGLALRAVLLSAIIAALAGAQLRLPSPQLTTVFVLDASDSLPAAERARGEALIAEAIAAVSGPDGTLQAGNQAAIVVFGEQALVERLASEGPLAQIASVPVTTRTDIAAALQLAQALLPPEGAKRLVLLSDGRQNLGQALQQAELAASSEIELTYVPLGAPGGEAEVRLERLDAPAEVRQGQVIRLSIEVVSTAQTAATLRIFDGDRLAREMEVTLQNGTNRFQVELPTTGQAGETGFRRFRAQVLPELDTRLQNNEAGAFSVVYGPPAVLIVEGEPGDAENLARALQASEMKVTRIDPAALPTTLAELAAYQAVVLANVNAGALPSGALELLQVYVRDLGMGLVMSGGPQSFGAGGYLRTPLEKALPVDMDVRDKDMQANLALVLAVDKSGSMGRCHCDNPDLNQSYTPTLSGQAKVDIAKEAIMRSAGALGDQDFLGVLAFDDRPRWALPLSRMVDPAALEGAISGFGAEGQTNLEAGVAEAYKALQGVQARRKHVILMTDGWVRRGDLTPLADEMAKEGITLSVVAAGEGSAEYLLALSQIGGGTFYPAVDIFHVPDIFLKETVKSVGEYIIEEPFYPLPSAPSPALSGIDVTRLPALLGYNGTTGKNTARMDLLTARGDPLLATWQYGLGRSAAWTSDLRSQWGKDLVAWEGFSRFATQMVDWVLPAQKTDGLEATARLDEHRAVVDLKALDPSGQPRNFLSGQATLIGPDLQAVEAKLEQVGAGQYRAEAPVDRPGAYLVRLGVNQGDQSLGQVTLGLAVPYSPEYKETGVDRGLLNELARLTGGGELPAPAAAFAHNLPSAAQAREIWEPLLLLAALLFPLDVALRRLAFSRKDWQRGRAWLDQRLAVLRGLRRPGRQAGEAPAVLGQLFEARQRARHRSGAEPQPPGPADEFPVPPEKPDAGPRRPADRPTPAGSHRPADAPPTPPPADAPPPADEASTGDSLARLREAKKRANKRG